MARRRRKRSSFFRDLGKFINAVRNINTRAVEIGNARATKKDTRTRRTQTARQARAPRTMAKAGLAPINPSLAFQSPDTDTAPQATRRAKNGKSVISAEEYRVAGLQGTSDVDWAWLVPIGPTEPVPRETDRSRSLDVQQKRMRAAGLCGARNKTATGLCGHRVKPNTPKCAAGHHPNAR